MSSEELKPCPFCGGDVSFHKDEECAGCHLIQCGQCRAFFDFATGADPGNDCESVDALRSAIAPMWNTRARLAAIQGGMGEAAEVETWRSNALMLEQANAGLAQLNGKLRAELAEVKGREAVGKVVAISGFRQAAVLLDAYQTASAGQSLVGSKLYATPPASPDVEGLVKVLEKIAEKCSDPDTTDALDTAISTWRQAQEGKP